MTGSARRSSSSPGHRNAAPSSVEKPRAASGERDLDRSVPWLSQRLLPELENLVLDVPPAIGIASDVEEDLHVYDDESCEGVEAHISVLRGQIDAIFSSVRASCT
jgi:hypothetical protein